jgi:hypothetical protein
MDGVLYTIRIIVLFRASFGKYTEINGCERPFFAYLDTESSLFWTLSLDGLYAA